MDYEQTDYVKLPIAQYPPRELRETEESKFWKKYKCVLSEKLPGGVSSLDFCPTSPYDLAATSSMRVRTFGGLTLAKGRTFSRFKDVAYSGAWRRDGAVLAAGCADGVVRAFDVGSRTILRELRGHTRPPRAVACDPLDLGRVVSGGDDATVRLWDLASGEEVARLAAHQDYVRALAPHPVARGTFLVGGYDGQVLLWDSRAGSSPAGDGEDAGQGGGPIVPTGSDGPGVVARFSSGGTPVEALAFLPGGALAAAAAGPAVQVWDLVAGARRPPLARLANHAKTVTSLAVARRSREAGSGPRLLAASLDGNVKAYDPAAGFALVASAAYGTPILSVAASPDGSTLAVGASDGSLIVRRNARVLREERDLADGRVSAALAGGGAAGAGRAAPERGAGSASTSSPAAASGAGDEWTSRPAARPRRLTAASYRFFVRGQSSKAGQGDTVVAPSARPRDAPHDRALRRFQHGEALDCALRSGRAAVVASVLDELAARGALDAALGGRSPERLAPLLRHLRKAARDERHAAGAIAVADRVLDLYGSEAEGPLADDLRRLAQGVRAELATLRELARVQGALELLLATAAAA